MGWGLLGSLPSILAPLAIYAATGHPGLPGFTCWLPIFMQRKILRERNGYTGDDCEDFMVACCCTCCASIQIANELETMKSGEMNLATIQLHRHQWDKPQWD